MSMRGTSSPQRCLKQCQAVLCRIHIVVDVRRPMVIRHRSSLSLRLGLCGGTPLTFGGAPLSPA
eukprot:9459941-Alexandrium_andersonii.AAC.1